MFNQTIAVITILAALLIVYHHAIYPVFLNWLGKRKRNQRSTTLLAAEENSLNTDILPSITIVIPAYNEANYIADKIRNTGALDYPTDRLKVIVVMDGCSDDTAAIAKKTAAEIECEHLNLEIIDHQQNRGKVAILNETISQTDTNIVALSDVSALVSIDAMHKLAERFADPDTGVVSSNYHLLNPGSEGEAVYWRYQRNIKHNEAAIGGLLGAHGAFYAFRRELFQPFEADTINDDFILPMRIMAKGYQGHYAGDINALELENATQQMDSHRRKRIAAGNIQQLIRLRALLSPYRKGIAFTFASGKALRVIMPWLMLIALVGSIWLSFTSLLFLSAAIIQMAVYSIALSVHIRGIEKCHKISRAIYYLVLGHLSNLIGTLDYLRNKRKSWKLDS